VHNAIINAVGKNVVVCFAAGNDNNNIDVTPQYPAIYPEVIAVGATDSKDVRASFSNYGTKVDVSAPGVSIYSTMPGNTYGFLDGTSMASPHAAGVSALIWSRNKKLTNQQVRDILQNNCDNIDAKNPGFAGKLGKGRINAFRALSNTPVPEIDAKVFTKIKFPQKNDGSSTGLAFVRLFLLGGVLRPVLMFLTQKPFSERIYYLNPSTGTVLGSVDPAANDTIGSLEWDGKYIQVANVTTGSGFINAINPQTGAQVGSLAVPAGRGEALTIVGSNYFYSTINRIYVINRTTGAIVSSFIPPGGPCYGLAYGDGLVFSANSATGVITAFDPNTRIVKGTLNAPGGGAQKAQALAYDAAANRLYVANQSENVIYALTLTL
jgi:outer membrane protein assembly factor BamB